MTTEQIKDLIASKIAGQGNQVDSGGKLADILNALAENAGGGGAPVTLEAQSLYDLTFLEQLRQRIDSGQLCNTIIAVTSIDPATHLNVYDKCVPLCYSETGCYNILTLMRYNTSETDYLEYVDVPKYTEVQFGVLETIQVALGGAKVDLITMSNGEGDEDSFLGEDAEGKFICVDGKLLEVSITTDSESPCPEGEIIASLTKSGLSPEGEYINITMEDAQKLIGIPINRL